MTLDFTQDGEVTIDMIDYVKNVITNAPEQMKGMAKTPATANLFKVNPNATRLNRQDSKTFHRIVMQLLYLSQRARPDIRTAVSFLCRRTTKADTDDWKKLVRVIEYLHNTTDLKLRIRPNSSGKIRWWIDAAYGIHSDMKGHTSCMMNMGDGSIYYSSSCQKINTRSSTECEVVGVHDIMPQAIWTKNFLSNQGFDNLETIVLRDNKSALLLETNGRLSSGKRTKHMDIRYFSVKDLIDKKEIRIEWCQTEKMWADFFTKPLTGTLFFRMRDVIMNIDPNDKYHSDHRSVLEKS
jgi:hypothetical protein